MLFSFFVYNTKVDNDIPIVIIDRLKFAKRERKKCEYLQSKFESTLDFKYLSALITKICNNMVGCMKLDENDNSIYHDYFDYEYLKDVLNREIKLILSQDNTTKNILLNNLYELSLSEQFLSSYQDKIEKLINNSYNDEDKQNISR